MKLPKLYALNALLGLVRSKRESYHLDENKCFTPKTHEDFYFFIKQGFLLSDDPEVKVNSYKININMTDEDIKREMALRKGNGIVPKIENDQEFKEQCYKDFFAKVDREVESGKIAGYPSDMPEKAESYYQEMKAKRIKEMTVPASTIDKSENGPVISEGDENIGEADSEAAKTEDKKEDTKTLEVESTTEVASV